MTLRKIWLLLFATIIAVAGLASTASAGQYVHTDVISWSDADKTLGYPRNWTSEQDSITSMIAKGYLLYTAAQGDSVFTRAHSLLYDVTMPGFPDGLQIQPDSFSFSLEGGLWPNATSDNDTISYMVGMETADNRDGPWLQYPSGYAKVDTSTNLVVAAADTMVYSYDADEREPSFTNARREVGGFDTGGLIPARFYRFYIRNKSTTTGDVTHSGNATLWYRLTVRKHYTIN